jgi:putative tricarboxylic transport membrane protein
MTGFRFSNRTVAVAIALVATGYLVLACQLPDFVAVNVPVQPATLPRWLGVVLLVLAVALFFQRNEPTGGTDAPTDAVAAAGQHHTATSAGSAADPGARAEAAPGLGRFHDVRLEVAIFVGAVFLYIALFEPLGFVLSTVLFIGGVTWYLGYPRHLVNAVVSVVLAVGMYVGMTQGLDVALPAGPFPF